LNALYTAREKACATLEKTCASLLRAATKSWAGAQRAHARAVHTAEKAHSADVRRAAKAQAAQRAPGQGTLDPEALVPAVAGVDSGELAQKAAGWEFLDELVPEARRPKVRQGALRAVGLGHKEDAYTWCKVRAGDAEKSDTGAYGAGRRRSRA
jgi:hypothetical protein